MKTTPAKIATENQAASPAEPAFPSVRYFQIHFEYLHDTIDDLKKQVNKANQQIAELQQQLQAGSAAAGIGGTGYAGERKAPPSNFRQS